MKENLSYGQEKKILKHSLENQDMGYIAKYNVVNILQIHIILIKTRFQIHRNTLKIHHANHYKSRKYTKYTVFV